MYNNIIRLQEWYKLQCEEVQEGKQPWQHRYGVSIHTIDNPGWNIVIDLEKTALDGVTMDAIDIDNGDADWILCKTTGNQFIGMGDPSKLNTIINIFLKLI